MTSKNMASKIYVFAPTTAGHILAGRALWDNKVGTFEYAQTFLDHPQSYALDPRNLPLAQRVFSTQSNDGVFGVLADAGPDSWGKLVIERRHSQVPANPLEYLISGNGDGVGALRFSLSRDAVGKLPNHLAIEKIEMVAQAEQDMQDGRPMDDQARQMLWEAGSSMGGARPKLTVGQGTNTWMVKLARNDDPVNMAILECACSQIARAAGLEVPESYVSVVGKQSALFVRRFDRIEQDQRIHYLSAHALLNLHKIGPNDVVAPMGVCTYGGLAALAQHSMGLVAGPELFARMVLNVLLGNTDDHGRNLGFLKPLGQPWALAPVFDVTVLGARQHAMGLGRDGRAATLANACSDLDRFQISAHQARETVQRTQEAVAGLTKRMIQMGASSTDIEWVQRRIPAAEEIPALEGGTSARRSRTI
jgi:serine/threonine-protein kinase HipA